MHRFVRVRGFTQRCRLIEPVSDDVLKDGKMVKKGTRVTQHPNPILSTYLSPLIICNDDFMTIENISTRMTHVLSMLIHACVVVLVQRTNGRLVGVPLWAQAGPF